MKASLDRIEKFLIAAMFGLVLLFVWVFTTMGQARSVEQAEIIKKSGSQYYVMVGEDTVATRRDFHKVFGDLHYYAQRAEGRQVWYKYEEIGTLDYSYFDSLQVGIESLALRSVNWQHTSFPDSSLQLLTTTLQSTADSLHIHYFSADSSGTLISQTHRIYPASEQVTDILEFTRAAEIQVLIEAYSGDRVYSYQYIFDAHLISFQDSKKKEVMALADTPYITVPWTAPASDLTDYVGYYDLADAPQSWWDEVDTADGTKLRVAKDDAAANATTATELAFEVVDFDDVAQTGQLWFRWSGTLPSSSPDEVRIYAPQDSYTSYGVTDTFGRNAVWVNFEAVLHLNEDPSGTAPQFTDATGNGYNGTANGSMTSGDLITTSPLGGGIEFDGVNDKIELANPIILNAGDTGLSIYHNHASNSNSNAIFMGSEYKVDPQWPYNIMHYRFSDDLIYQYNNNQYSFTLGYSANTWFKTNFGIDNSFNIRAFSDGTALAENPIAAENANIEFQVLGGRGLTGDGDEDFYNGRLDEFRIANFEITADWDALEYANQNDPASFWGTPTFVAAVGGGTTLESNDLQSVNELEQSGLTVSYALGGNNLQSLNELQQSGLTVDYSLGGNNLESLNQLTQSGLDVNYALSPNGLESLNQIQQSALTVLYNLSPNNLQNINELEQSGLGTGVQLSPNDIQSLNQLTQSGLTVSYVLSPEDMQSVSELEQSAIDVLYSLLPNAIQSQNTLEQSAVTVNYGLTPASLENINELQQAALTPFYVIDPNNLENINEVESTVLGTIGQATKVSLDAKELYIIDLQAKKLYTITTDEKELYTITLDSNEVIE